jgi:hypothetical protein
MSVLEYGSVEVGCPGPVVVTIRPCVEGEAEHVDDLEWNHVVVVYEPDFTAGRMAALLAEPMGRRGIVVEVQRAVDAFEVAAHPAECHVYLNGGERVKRRPGPPPRQETARERARRQRRAQR